MDNGDEASMPTVRQMWLAMKQMEQDMVEMKGQINQLCQKMGRVETVVSASLSQRVGGHLDFRTTHLQRDGLNFQSVTKLQYQRNFEVFKMLFLGYINYHIVSIRVQQYKNYQRINLISVSTRDLHSSKTANDFRRAIKTYLYQPHLSSN